MNILLTKLNYKTQQRIAIINADNMFIQAFSRELLNVQIDTDIDQRYLYNFIIIFVQLVSEVEDLVPKAIHNLSTDGILWFAYPKKASRKFSSDIDRDHGWEILTERGFDKVRQVSIDDDWAALRFRNVRFIKSSHSRFS